MFPYRVGQYGGAAFLIPYFLFVALFGWVGLSGEFGLGRLTGTGPIGSYDYAMKSRRQARRQIFRGDSTVRLARYRDRVFDRGRLGPAFDVRIADRRDARFRRG